MALMTQVGLEFIARDRSQAGMASFNRGLTTMTRSVLQLAGIGGGIYMLQRGIRNFISEASRSEETFAKFDVVFRDQAESARKWAEDFGDSVGRATQDVAEWMAGLQDTFVPLGIARGKAAELSKSLVSLAVDVASFNNKADADVIRDFTSALVGNHETVRKYGIIISENAIKQEAWRIGLNKTFAQLTDLEKVQLRYNLIQAGTSDAQGDAIRTADSYANQVKRLSGGWKEFSAAMGEFGTAIGKEVLPPLTSTVNKMTELIKATEAQADAIRKYKEATGDIKAFGSQRMIGLSGPGGGVIQPEYPKMFEFFRRQALAGKPVGLFPPQDVIDAAAERMKAVEKLTENAFIGPLPPEDLAKRQADLNKRINAQIIADTREQLASVRSMHDKTRLEKIAILQQYVSEHKRDLDKIAEAEKLLNDEILALERSRIGGMKVYSAELREDMENTSLYISDKFAEAARSIESSMSSAFESMIADGSSFRDAMRQFFMDVSRAFAKMAADMLARNVMSNVAQPLMNGLMSALTGGGGAYAPNFSTSVSNAGVPPVPAVVSHRGGMVGDIIESRMVSPMTFAGAPRLHGGLASDEFPAILQRGEQVIPKNARMSAPSINVYNESGRQIEQKSEPEFDGERWVVSLIARNYSQGGSLKKLLK